MKLLIQGCGYIGEVHLKSIVNYKLCDVALCEVNEDRLSSLAATYGIKEIYHSLDDALEHQFDGVVICTPNFAHKTDLEKCVKVGMDVFLEKPISESVTTAKEIVDLCDKYNRFAFIGYCLRFAPPYKKIKTLVDSGELGKVFSIRASVAGKKAITDAHTNYRAVKKLGGGVISDFSHEIDYSLWFAGKPVKMVKSIGSKAIHKDWDVLDTAELIIGCEDDINLSIHMDFLQPYFGRSIEIYGTKSSIRWRDNEPIKIYNPSLEKWDEIDSVINWNHVYRDEMIYYIHCLIEGTRPMIDENYGYELMKIIDSCEQSAENN